MVEQCHKRGMELHAWINPFRARTKTTKDLAPNHIAVQHPERVFNYDGLLILNPAFAENRAYICHVCGDILRRYDVDGIHYDDYFYPYPAAGQQIPDQKYFAANSLGFKNIGDWRRNNVSLFVKQLCDTVRAVKPWAKVGNLFKISGYNSVGFLSCGLLFQSDGFSKVKGFPLNTTSFNSGKFAKLLSSSIFEIRLFPIYNFSNLIKLLSPSNFSISL